VSIDSLQPTTFNNLLYWIFKDYNNEIKKNFSFKLLVVNDDEHKNFLTTSANSQENMVDNPDDLLTGV